MDRGQVLISISEVHRSHPWTDPKIGVCRGRLFAPCTVRQCGNIQLIQADSEIEILSLSR
jgi:hypothetical protein